MSFLRYHPAVEQIDKDEPALFQHIADTFKEVGRKVEDNEGAASRVSHAKATALLTGELTISRGLPDELAQGLAAARGRYEALVRFAQGPGENLNDRVSTHRGMAIKLLGLPGASIPESDEPGTQDLVLDARSRAFINSTAASFFANLRGGVSHAPSLPEGVKSAVSKVALATESALETVGLEAKTLGFFGHPPLHPLAETYFSQAPMRWGDYVAKVGVYPTEATCNGLASLKVDNKDNPNAFRQAMVEHFAANGAEFELRVQLATDPEVTPIEDASKEWPEDATPYQVVGRLTLPAQRAWTPERNAYFDRLSFRPAHSLTAHRPLGQVMRARLFVYEQLASFRQREIGEVPAHPTTIADLPA